MIKLNFLGDCFSLKMENPSPLIRANCDFSLSYIIEFHQIFRKSKMFLRFKSLEKCQNCRLRKIIRKLNSILTLRHRIILAPI